MVADGGSFGAVDVTASGVNKVYLKGDMSSVTVHLSGEGRCLWGKRGEWPAAG